MSSHRSATDKVGRDERKAARGRRGLRSGRLFWIIGATLLMAGCRHAVSDSPAQDPASEAQQDASDYSQAPAGELAPEPPPPPPPPPAPAGVPDAAEQDSPAPPLPANTDETTSDDGARPAQTRWQQWVAWVRSDRSHQLICVIAVKGLYWAYNHKSDQQIQEWEQENDSPVLRELLVFATQAVLNSTEDDVVENLCNPQ